MSDVEPATIDRLVAAAREVHRRAYAPYSGFHVGAAVLAGGDVFTGVNVENAAYPSGWCAERSAVAAAVTAGRTEIEAVAVVADNVSPTPPCGQCRQALNEFGPEMLVVCEGVDGARETWRLSEVLPHAFGPANLAG